jgi:hypothetical protein
MSMAKKDPWTDPDPQPGDFDEYLAEVDPRDVQYLEGSPGRRVVLVGPPGSGEDAATKEQQAAAHPPISALTQRVSRSSRKRKDS